MKRILIYGDSNVNGRNFITATTIPEDKQWPGILKTELGSGYVVYKNGLAGRLAGECDVAYKERNGRNEFLKIFKEHAPFDIIIIALGTNDLQPKYHRNALDICEDLYWYKEILYKMYENKTLKDRYFNDKLPEFIYLSPIKVDYQKRARRMFNHTSNDTREQLNEIAIDNLENYQILDDVQLFLDGIHLSSAGHNEVAKKLLKIVK